MCGSARSANRVGSWLEALNIDPEADARAYRERIVGPYRGKLPEAAVTSIEEQLSGACTVEIAAFDEFAKPAAGLSALTCWVFKINPLPTTGHVLDTGWFATFGLVYFFVLYLTIERLRRRRQAVPHFNAVIRAPLG